MPTGPAGGAILTLSKRPLASKRTGSEWSRAHTRTMNHSVTPDQPGVSSAAGPAPDELWWQQALLAAAARFASAPDRSATLLLRRRPGLVDRARAVAAEL